MGKTLKVGRKKTQEALAALILQHTVLVTTIFHPQCFNSVD